MGIYKKIMILLFVYILVFTIIGCEELAELDEPDIGVEVAEGEVESMKLEEYIEGVVAGEMKEGWPENAYAAQAIIARSYAMKFMEENDTDTISADFREAQEYKPEQITEEISEAVQKTRGELAKYEDRYIKGWFHASAGGHTTTAKVGLAYEDEEPPYIHPVESPDEESPEDVQNWTVSVSAEEIENVLSDMGYEIGQLEDVEIVDKDETGRIIDFNFVGSEESIEVKAANFRVEYDSQVLKSTKIDELNKENDNYEFSGSGFGHGVGLSQWGAYKMALEDEAPEDIVKHYFKDIEVIQAYE